MLIRIAILFFLVVGAVDANEAKTSGDCSPVIIDNKGNVSINCYINDLPIDSIVRQGRANDLIAAINSGISSEVILQAFVLGTVQNFSGASFFRKVEIDGLSKFLSKLKKDVNINNRIYFREDSYTTLFWLAAESKRKEVIYILSKMGASIHTRDHRYGGYYDKFMTKEFFPILDLIHDGVLSVDDRDILSELLENSFIFPDFNIETKSGGVILPINNSDSEDFLEKVALQNKIIELLPEAKTRKPFDMKNITKLCNAASESDNFDWCKRLSSVSKQYFVAPGDRSDLHWASIISLLGLMDINSDHATFLIHHNRWTGGVGQFRVPRKGNKFAVRYWNRQGTSNPCCWNEKLNGYKTDCWRTYPFEQDVFDKTKLVGKAGYPIYIAGDAKITFDQ